MKTGSNTKNAGAKTQETAQAQTAYPAFVHGTYHTYDRGSYRIHLRQDSSGAGK